MEYEIQINTEIRKSNQNISTRTLLYQFSKDVTSKPFKLQITDPEDSLFLYDAEISAEKYQNIKKEQYISTDFIDFPKRFMDLLTQNNQEASRQAVIDELTNPILILQQNTGFNIVFFLKLQLTLASDSRLKQFLSQEAKRFKTMYKDALNSIEEIKKLKNNEGKEYEAKIQEYQEKMKLLQKQFETKIQQNELDANQRIQKYEELIIQMKNSTEQGLALKERDIIEKYEKKIQDERNHYMTLIQEKANSDLISQKNIETIRNQDREITELKLTIKNLQENNQAKTAQLFEQKTQISSLQNEIQSLKEKSMFMQQRLEEKSTIMNSKISTVEELQSALSSKCDELNKVKADLARLYKMEEEFNFVKSKSKYVFSNQQKKLEDLANACSQQKKMIGQMNQKIQQYEYQNQNMSKQCTSMSTELAKLREVENQLRTDNAKMKSDIAHLNSNLKASRETIHMLEEQLTRPNTIPQVDMDMLPSDDEDANEFQNPFPGLFPPKNGVKLQQKTGRNKLHNDENLVNLY